MLLDPVPAVWAKGTAALFDGKTRGVIQVFPDLALLSILDRAS